MDTIGPRQSGHCGAALSLINRRHAPQAHMWPQGITAVSATASKQTTQSPSSVAPAEEDPAATGVTGAGVPAANTCADATLGAFNS